MGSNPTLTATLRPQGFGWLAAKTWQHAPQRHSPRMLDRATAYGLDFLFPAGDDTVGASLKRFGEFARPEVDLLIACAAAETGTFIDVGANIGAIALPFAKARPGWRVVALEAHRGLCNVLAANALNNGLYNVEVMHAAAGPETGLVNFPAPSLALTANYGTMSLARVTGAAEPTRMFRLDDLAPSDTALVKIDVEGYEPQVLAGAERLLAGGRVAWLAEASEQNATARRETLRILMASGLRPYWVFAPFVTPASERGGEPPSRWMGDSNVLAVPADQHAPWPLAGVSAADEAPPKDPGAYGYLARYGYD